MVIQRLNQSGYVALIAVLITGAIATSIALLLLTNGNDIQRGGQVEQQSIQARGLASACVEDALQLMHDTTSYAGTSTLNLGTGTCTYTVTNTGTSTRTITTTGTVQNVVRKVQVYVTIGSSSISITSWQEVS
ncbi:MAG TPA: hypothetical protein VHT70_03850 [Candidatus Saccharimonadales bacterium]|jgi:hypothetical protein|nr:hypothetical protein [Candidatus Saccharimonadales bacterium]